MPPPVSSLGIWYVRTLAKSQRRPRTDNIFLQNHSCDPNCGINAVYLNEANIEKPLLAIFTKRDIEPHEELCFSYMGPIDGEAESSSDSDDDDDDDVRVLVAIEASVVSQLRYRPHPKYVTALSTSSASAARPTAVARCGSRLLTPSPFTLLLRTVCIYRLLYSCQLFGICYGPSHVPYV